MSNDREIPRYIFEDLLFQKRLQRNLNDKLELLNSLLAEQVTLLEERKALMSEVSEAAEQRWHNEEQSTPVVIEEEDTKGDGRDGE